MELWPRNNKERPKRILYEFASFSLQGRRSSMEDAHQIVENFAGIKSDFFVAVYDGHSGDRCSKYLNENMCTELLNNINFNKNIEATFKEVFTKIDASWLKIVEEKNAKGEFWDDGSTAVCLLCKNNILSVANCGDSRLVVSRKGKAEQITIDHKPDMKDEKERLEEGNYKVSNNKLGGTLSVSRAFGDYSFKKPVSRGLIVDPDYFEIKGIEEIDFIVLACDGLFEESGQDEVVDFIKEKIAQHKPLDEVAKALCVDAIDMGSEDNVSVIIVRKVGMEEIPKTKEKVKGDKTDKSCEDKQQKKLDKEKKKLEEKLAEEKLAEEKKIVKAKKAEEKIVKRKALEDDQSKKKPESSPQERMLTTGIRNSNFKVANDTQSSSPTNLTSLSSGMTITTPTPNVIQNANQSPSKSKLSYTVQYVEDGSNQCDREKGKSDKNEHSGNDHRKEKKRISTDSLDKKETSDHSKEENKKKTHKHRSGLSKSQGIPYIDSSLPADDIKPVQKRTSTTNSLTNGIKT